MNKHHKPHLVILEQPIEKFRFRYKSEMLTAHGSITGDRSLKTNKTYPEVELKNFNKEAIIRCSLYQTDITPPSVHSHLLVVNKEGVEIPDPHDVKVSPDLGYIVRFENMGIINTAKKDILDELLEKKTKKLKFDLQSDDLSKRQMKSLKDAAKRESKHININQVCLCFEAFEIITEGKEYKKICEPEYSNPINNLKSAMTGDLKICRLSIYTGSVEGNDDLILLVEKVSKNNIRVRFFELDNDEEVWEAFGSFTETDVHHQYAIVVRTPPYKDEDIDNHVNVYIELVRDSDNKRSDAVPFRYKPKQIVLSRKRRKMSCSSNLVSVSSVSLFQMPESVPRQIQKLELEPKNTSTSDEECLKNDPYKLDMFLQRVDNDSEELKSLLPSVFSESGFHFWENELEIDGESGTKGQNKIHAFYPALKLLIRTFNNCPKIGLEKTINSIQKIYNTYTAISDNASTIMHDICKQSNDRFATTIFKIFSKLNMLHLLHQTNNNLQTPLHITCLFNQPAYIRHLIKLKCNPNTIDIDGNTALHIAVSDNLTECIDELVASATSCKLDANLNNNDGMTPLHLAIRKNNVELVRTLIVQCNASIKITDSRDSNNSLHLAVQHQNLEMIEIMLKNTDPSYLNIPNAANHTAVDLARCLRDPNKKEILEVMESFLRPPTEEESNLSLEDVETILKKTIEPEEEADIREKMQKDLKLRRKLNEILTVGEKWKDLVEELKLCHLICIWRDAEDMLKCVFGVKNIKIKSLVSALKTVDEEAAIVLSSYMIKNMNQD